MTKPDAARSWSVGSLVYCRAGLISLFGAVAAAIVYHQWKTLGGPKAYRAP